MQILQIIGASKASCDQNQEIGQMTIKKLPHSIIHDSATLKNCYDLMTDIINYIESGKNIEIDCSLVEQADITFVQTIVSAERTCAARGLPFTVLAATESVRSTFARAGVSLPGAPHSETSGN